jgi:hypothetical protein
MTIPSGMTGLVTPGGGFAAQRRTATRGIAEDPFIQDFGAEGRDGLLPGLIVHRGLWLQ